MLNNNIFYYGITRKIIVAFGSLFSDIRIRRESKDAIEDAVLQQTLNVPIAYAPKEKVLVRLEQDPSLDKYVYITLPRMSFEITGIEYDSSRHVSKINTIQCYDDETDEVNAMYAPVPYNIHISLSAITKTTEDGLQIVEQILPYFVPEFTLQLKVMDKPNIALDIPVILNNVSLDDQYSGDFQTRRFIVWSFDFTLKTSFFGPITKQGRITHVMVNLSEDETGDIDLANYDLVGDLKTKAIISETWTEE